MPACPNEARSQPGRTVREGWGRADCARPLVMRVAAGDARRRSISMTASLDPFQSPVQPFSFGAWQLLLGGSGRYNSTAARLVFGSTRH
ncbi:hypothetical protein SKAU_G00220240 [Synaphobranchus kaupii]|uniref:Uncharacterized protein n=1 Tax=Synaphobranchus kaupii TaxID=118154 RepID=A0A9Q1FAV7_SYNKA|nr:hypothetical protein SKAU_G00220240 [Synaphobranchus kaupii]